MRPRDTIETVLSHEEAHPVPFRLGFHEGIAARIDDHFGDDGWRETVRDPYMAGCSVFDVPGKKPLEDDPTRAADCFGGIWRIDGKADHQERPALPEPDLDKLRLPDADTIRNPEQLEKCRQFIDEHPDLYIGASVWGTGLYETTWYLRGFENALADAAGDEEFYGALVDRIAEAVEAALDVALELTVDYVAFGDDLGDQNGVTIGPDRWRRFFKEHWARLCGKAHAAGKKVFLHSCGSVADVVPDLIEVGIDVLDPVQPEPRGMNPYELKAAYGDRIVFHGGLGSQSTIPFGTPDEIRAEVKRLCARMGRNGGYILAPAKAIRDETPLENALAVLDVFTNQEA